MSNSFPKFKVGEVVILQSTGYPELNGEYTVTRAIAKGEIFEDARTSIRISAEWQSSPWAYVLDMTHHKENENDFYWAEVVLRKKHLPGELSFDTLMSSLKLGQPVRV